MLKCLLIIVLIVVILLIVAFPQYKKAKGQSVKAEALYMAEAVQYLEDFAAAQKAYYAQHKDFATDIKDLDIVLPKPGGNFDYVTDQINEGVLYAFHHNKGILTIAVDEMTDIITRDCEGPDGFCRLAESAGYKRGAIDSIINGPEK